MRPPSKPERLAASLRQRIADDDLVPGSYLGTKPALGAEYGAALSTVNEALSILKSEGLVRVKTGPGGGVLVAESPPLVRLGRKLLQLHGSSTDVAECIAVRNALEGIVASDAARHVTRDAAADLRAIGDRMREHHDDDFAFMRLNFELHQRIARIVPDGLTQSIYLGVTAYIDERAVGVIPDPGTTDRAAIRLRVHLDLIEAIATGDVEAAARTEAIHRSFADRGGTDLK